MHMAEQTRYGQNQYSISSAVFPAGWTDLMEEDHRGLPHSGHKTRNHYLQWWGEGGEKDISSAVSLEKKHKIK